MSFSQFLQSIVSGYDDLGPERVNLLTTGAALHWLPYYIQCNPCNNVFNPQTVIHLKSWQQDTHHLLDKIGVDTNRYNLNLIFKLCSNWQGNYTKEV